MKRTLSLLLCLFAGGFFAGPTPAIADDAPLRVMGGAASPMQITPKIRMEAEEVTIRLGRTSYTVDALFRFFNTGEMDRLSVGFPKRGLGLLNTFRGTDAFLQFETWVDDRKVEFSEESDSSSIEGIGINLPQLLEYIREKRTEGLFAKDARWMVKEVSFPSQATTTTRVNYEAPYSVSEAGCMAYYIYGTGSYWKDNIGEATFTIDGTDVRHISDVTFSDSQRRDIQKESVSDSVIKYVIRNFKPRFDEKLLILVDSSAPLVGPDALRNEATAVGVTTFKGVVVASSPTSLSIERTSEANGGVDRVITVQVGPRTLFVPMRRARVGEKVEVVYSDENEKRVARRIEVLYR